MSDEITDKQWQRMIEHFGCPICDTISLHGAHVCEHGVTACDPITIEGILTTTLDVYQRLFPEA